METDRLLQVTVVYAPLSRQAREHLLEVKSGSTVAQCLSASGLLSGMSADDLLQMRVGVWGRKCALAHIVRDGDRVELYRALRVDPKVARRERFNRQGAKAAGLFATRRAGAKAGY